MNKRSEIDARYAGLAPMTGRASRAQKLAPSFLVVATALACGSSHGGGGDDPSNGGSGAGGSTQNIAGFGNPPAPGTGGGPMPVGGTAPSNGGFATAGFAGAFVTGGAGGFGAGGAIGGFGGAIGGFGGAIGGSGGSAGAKNPPGSCPPQPPPNGSSCANYFEDPGHHCYYDAPACRVVSTCVAGTKWRSGCEAPGEAGAPSDAGASGF